MKFSVRRKLLLLLISLVMLGFVIGLTVVAAFANRYYVSVKQNEMLNAYYVISSIVNENDNTDNSFRQLASICEESGFSMLICKSSGEAIFSYGNSDILKGRLNALTFSNLYKSNSSIVRNYQDVYFIQTVRGEGGRIEYLEMFGFFSEDTRFVYRCPYSAIQNNINLTVRFYFILYLVICSVFVIISAFAVNSFSSALKGLAKESKKIREGDFETNFESKRKRYDELGAIGANMNEISHRLEKTVSELKTSNLNLKNELKAKEKLEEQRKKYMSDVSHELKTPIALISGYAEGLKEGISESKEDRDYYCDVIIDEANKMNTLVKRLSTLNQLEQGKSAVNLERFNVIEVIDGFLNNMSIIIQESNADIYFNNKDVAYVWCDEFLFEEVLVNYFNNALHHLDEKKIIKINTERIGNFIRVTVFNSGKPIPEDEIDKIWGKFYKVDKARTREYGGSGLGLSIVKAIADSLGRECGVYNLPDGVAFYLDMEAATKDLDGENVDIKNEKPEKTSILKLAELPIWKSLRKNSLQVDDIKEQEESDHDASDKQ